MLHHQHLIVRAEIANPPQEKDLPFMTEWFKELIEDINMKILMGPHVVYSNMVGNRGFTGVAVIETSHVAMHVWDEDKPGMMQLDVYTCSSLDIQTVMNKLVCFKPVKIEYKFLDREHGLVEVKDYFWNEQAA